MTCARCNAENPEHGKYCHSCGASLGTFCTKCGEPTRPDDRFCVTCGAPMALALEDEPPTLVSSIPPSTSGSTKQYSPQEIEELLTIRRTMKREETVKAMRQDDVDKLFG